MANNSKEPQEQKETDRMLKRSDDIYMRIESFKNSELTNAITFEMAIRNPTLIIRLNRIINFYYKHREKIDFIPENYEYFNTAFEYRFHRRVQQTFHYWFDYIRYIYWIKPQDLLYAKMEEDTAYMLNSHNNFVNTNDISQNRMGSQHHIVDSDSVIFKTSIDYENRQFFEDNENPSKEDILKAIKEHKLNPCLFKRNNTIEVNSSHPKLTVPAVLSKEFNLELNMALPKSELISYIEHIKDSYDNSKNDIKMIAEVLGVDKEDFWFSGADAEGFHKRDRRKIPSERLADLIFIFDCNKNKVKVEDTIDLLDVYWREERKAFPEKFQKKTYQRYLRLAKDFINNKKYQSLLIGQ